MSRFFSNVTRSPSFPAFVLLAILFIVNIFITSGFLGASYLSGFFASNAPLICIAIGASLVIITAGIDLSAGAIITLTNVIMVTMFGAGWGLAPTIIICLLLAVGMGALNGVLVGILRVNSLMATFATQSTFAGIALWIMAIPGGSIPPALSKWYNSAIAGIPVSVWMIVIVFAAAMIILKSPIGTKLYAIGKNEEKAYISGMHVSRIKFMAYTFSGLTAGVAALCMTARIGGGDPTVALSIQLTCIASCVIGGVDLAGGKGSCFGPIWGAMSLILVIVTVFSAGVTVYQQSLVSGIITLAAIVGTVAISTVRSNKKQLRALKVGGGNQA